MAHKGNKPLEKQATAFNSTTYTETPFTFCLSKFGNINLHFSFRRVHVYNENKL